MLARRGESAHFETPTGWRRLLALFLVLAGIFALIGPLLLGHWPVQPAGVPLGFLTLGLLVGIRASWLGGLGAACLWLVPNLPNFHYGTSLVAFWPAWLLIIPGILLLALDRHVRALWFWLITQVWRER
ncbi:MAG: hypothetical protein HC837_18325 [Chloroflexaceae bacterium]|nr:hypothetical protein [Chloroflexaceae bacterium]